MKKLMNRAGLLAAAFALVLAVALALNAAEQTPAAAQTPAGLTPGAFDALFGGALGGDMDKDGLIDITTPQQLNAIRYDTDGNGFHNDVAEADQRRRDSKCLGRPECIGYELMNDISLASYTANGANGAWVPIEGWGGLLEGDMFRITGLNVKRNSGPDGLFGWLSSGAVVKHVVVDAEIESSGGLTGVLAGSNYGTIIGSYATGKLTSSLTSSSGAMGGLVGYNKSGGKIYASVAKVEVKVKGKANVMRAAGFVGMNRGEIRQSYAYGDVIEIRNNNSHRLTLRSFAPSQGTIDRSISYGDIIVESEDGRRNLVASSPPNPIRFGAGTNSCALRDETVVTCDTPTPTPTGD